MELKKPLVHKLFRKALAKLLIFAIGRVEICSLFGKIRVTLQKSSGAIFFSASEHELVGMV